ncbi:MAG: hypothetical protein KGM47_12130 [Acidobacteriota bacterium]|nr:hypothetical protein [Acidobacteriota bacterium]
MSQLTFSAIPGFFDLADSAIAGNQPLTDDSLQKISHNAKFAAVRCEIIFMGFYTSGNTVPPPVSPVDGYVYSRGECMFIPIFASSREPAAGFIPGQAQFPVLANTDLGTGALVMVPYQLDVNDATGVITCEVYFGGNGPQNQGTVKVYAICQRSSLSENN